MRQPRLWTAVAIVALLTRPSVVEAGAWVLPRGVHWYRVGFVYQETDERYFLDGERIPYFFDGHNQTSAGFFDLRRGLGGGVEASVQLPFYSIRFDDLADERRSTGIGDIRAGARWAVVDGSTVVTIGSTVKFPSGEFVNDAEVVPVGEGQYDFEVGAEIGRSLWPRPGYVTGQVGYRFRTRNEESGIDPGDEIFWLVEGGWRFTSRWMVKAVVRGLYGRQATSFGLPIDSLRREIVYVEPGVIVSLSPTSNVEVTVPVSLRGRNWPAGPVLNIGFFQRF